MRMGTTSVRTALIVVLGLLVMIRLVSDRFFLPGGGEYAAIQTTTESGQEASSGDAIPVDQLVSYIHDSLQAVGLPFTAPADASGKAALTTTTTTTTTTTIPSTYTGFIAPLWNCSSTPRGREKLIFVHVFKTAGSSFRTFFDYYGYRCEKATTVVATCTDVSVSSLRGDESTLWQSSSNSDAAKGGGGGDNRQQHHSQRCFNRSTRLRDGNVLTRNQNGYSSTITRSFLARHNVDIVAGHLPVGIHEYWTIDPFQRPSSLLSPSDQAAAVVEARYVTFFREPIAKWVSGRLYTHREWNWTIDEAVSDIQQWVRREVAKGAYYNKYKTYLLTPLQKSEESGGDALLSPESHTSPEVIVQTIQENLLHYNVLVGILERMSDSLSLLQSVIDVDRSLTAAFALMNAGSGVGGGGGDGGGSSTNPRSKQDLVLIRNRSSLSTNEIVQRLQHDSEFLPVIREYLKYEFQLYDFALQVHRKQVRTLQERHGNRYRIS